MSYRRILVPFDGSPTSNKALVAALQLARERGAIVRLVHALDDLTFVAAYDDATRLMAHARKQGQQILEDGLAIVRAGGVEGDTQLCESLGRQLGQIVAEEAQSWNADLIVVGTHGRRGFSRLVLGSGAENVIRLAPIPVLVIRGS